MKCLRNSSNEALLVCILAMAGCRGVGEETVNGSSRFGSAIDGLTSKTIHPDGTFTTAPISGKVFYWNGTKTPGNEVYAFVIGENFHAVAGCSLADFNAVLGDPLNRPVEQLESVARTNPATGLPYEIRARFSCGEEPGDLPYATTLYYLDDAAARYYFPTGQSGEYYSFADGDKCLNLLRASLFKLDDREAYYPGEWMSGKPPDLSTEIQLGCDAEVSDGPYRIYLDQDYSVPTPYDGWYVVVEMKNAQATAYLPVYRINGDGVNGDTLGLLQDWLHLPRMSDLPPLTEARGFQSTDPNVDPIVGAQANIVLWKKNRRFWDLYLGDPSAKPPSYQHQHYLYEAPTAAVAGTYREELLLDGSAMDRAVDAAAAPSPPLVGCEGTLETTFGLSRDTAPGDSRSWTTIQSQNILQPRPPEARFQCPGSADAHVCRLALGAAQPPNNAQTMGLRNLNDLIASAYSTCAQQQRTELEITLNSDLDVTLLPLAYLNFASFRAVTLKSAFGTKYLRFHERCDDANPCLRTNSSSARPLVSISVGDPTRSLVVDHVALQYVAENLTTPPDGGSAGGSFFNMTVVFLRTAGTMTSRVRVVLVDSSIGADGNSPKFLSQALAATFADVFLVRSTLQGTSDATSAWKTLAASDSLIVLAGAQASPSLLLGAGGGARFSDGHNDVLAVNSVVQGPLVANAISQSTWIDTMLYRPTGKEALHFTGTESTGFPTRYTMMWTGSNSRVMNLQHALATPFAQFDPGLATVPKVMMMATMSSYFDGSDSSLGAVPLDQATLGKTLFCNSARGSFRMPSPLSERCPTH